MPEPHAAHSGSRLIFTLAKKMKSILIYLGLLFSLFGSSVLAEGFLVPIVVDIRHYDPNKPVINNEEMTVVEAMSVLSKSFQKFGREDPIIIRLESNADILEAANLARKVARLYNHVFIALRRDGVSDSGPLILAIGRDEPCVDIRPLFPSLRSQPSRINSDPNRARDQQVEQLRRIQHGEQN